MSDLDVRKVCDQLEGLAVSINRHGDSDVLVAAADLLRSLEESASQVVGLSADVTRLRAALIESMNEGGTIADKLGAAEAQVAELRSALEAIAAQQPKTLQTLRSNGVVFDGPLGADPKNWQHVAFSIYTDLCEVDTIADNALADLSHSESPLPQAAEVRVKELEQQMESAPTKERSDAQARFAMQQMSRWLRLRAAHENLENRLGLYGVDVEKKRAALWQLVADVDHSALLYRLLRGREPLPEPPPTQHSYPVYPDWPYDDATSADVSPLPASSVVPVEALLFEDVLVEPHTGPRILTLDQQRWLLSECRRQREWVTATVEMTELAKVILGADLVGYDPVREPPRPEDMVDGGEVWAERLAWLVLQADGPARSVRGGLSALKNSPVAAPAEGQT